MSFRAWVGNKRGKIPMLKQYSGCVEISVPIWDFRNCISRCFGCGLFPWSTVVVLAPRGFFKLYFLGVAILPGLLEWYKPVDDWFARDGVRPIGVRGWRLAGRGIPDCALYALVLCCGFQTFMFSEILHSFVQFTAHSVSVADIVTVGQDVPVALFTCVNNATRRLHTKTA